MHKRVKQFHLTPCPLLELVSKTTRCPECGVTVLVLQLARHIKVHCCHEMLVKK